MIFFLQRLFLFFHTLQNVSPSFFFFSQESTARKLSLIRICSVTILAIMSSGTTAALLPLIQRNFTRYGLSTLLALGNLGTISNILIFSRSRAHRANSCSLYLLAAACFNLVAINLGLVTTLYSLDHQDPATLSEFFCKAKAYVTHIVFNTSRWLVVLACADRFAVCHMQARIRSWSSPRFARRAIALLTCLWTVIALHVPIWQGIHLGACGPFGTYALAWGIYQFLIVGVFPPLAMTIFGILTLKNLRFIRSRLQAGTGAGAVQLQPRDISMMRMVAAEIFVYILSTIWHPISQLYSTISNSVVTDKSTARKQIEGFTLYLTMSFLVYVNFCATFYIYMAVSRSFRHEFKRLVARCLGIRSVIEPFRNTNLSMTVSVKRHSRQLPAPQQTPV